MNEPKSFQNRQQTKAFLKRMFDEFSTKLHEVKVAEKDNSALLAYKLFELERWLDNHPKFVRILAKCARDTGRPEVNQMIQSLRSLLPRYLKGI